MAHLFKRKMKDGHRWYVRYTLNGKEHWMAAGPQRKAAERIRDTVAARVLEGKMGLLTEKSDWTVNLLLDEYLPVMDELKPRSAAWRRHRAAHLRRLMGERKLEMVTMGTVDGYASTRLKEGASAGTVNSEVAVVRHAFGKAFLWRDRSGLQVNRLKDGWRPLKGQKIKPRFLERDEVERLMAVSARRSGHVGHTFLMLFLATGARPGELLALTADDVHESTVRLPALKGGVPRVVVVDSEVLARVRESLDRWTKQRVRKHWEWVRDEANLGEVRFYDIRHTVASEMLKRGATMRDVQRLFGHQTARMTERYAHFSKNAGALPSLTWAN